nr:hypothetical protein [Mycoplasmopsis bovis]
MLNKIILATSEKIVKSSISNEAIVDKSSNTNKTRKIKIKRWFKQEKR